MSSSKTIRTRVILGSLMIFILAGLFAVDVYFYQRNIVQTSSILEKLANRGLIIEIIVVGIAILLSHELLNFARSTGASPFAFLTIIGAAILSFPVLLPLIDVKFNLIVNCSEILCLWILLLFFAQIIRGDTIRAGANISWSILIVIYAGLLLSYIAKLRLSFGPYSLIIMISAVKGADIGAYFTGTAIGRHKLIPWLSPGKSIEGLIGAIVFGAVITLGLICVIPRYGIISTLYNLGTIKLLLIGGFLAFVGQFGDLSESLLKRDAAIKDSSRLIPEFGGFCDLLDSVLPAGFIWYWMLKLISVS